MSDIASEVPTSEGHVVTISQEIANAVTHGLGVLLSIAGLVILVVQAARFGDAWHVVSYAVFGTSMILLYLASTLYHSIQAPPIKRVFEIFDHAAIFVLIAGSYTAFSLTLLRGGSGWWIFGIVWAIAAFGIVMEALFLDRWPFLTLGIYLAMGWLIVFVWKPLSLIAPPATIAFLIAGGLSYTVGSIFYALGRRRGWYHTGWHLFVIGGTACHFFAALAALPR
jgi:hemolysin III